MPVAQPPAPPTVRELERVARQLDEEAERLRPGQREAIQAVLERDTLAVLATGTGKTLVYQVAASRLDGPALVLSPTIALQADQAAALRESGADVDRLDGSRRGRRRKEIVDRFVAGDLDYLLLTPEQLADEELVARLAEARPGLVVVDEAHCVSAWGEDFRPDYAALGARIGALGRPRVLALTATAPPSVRGDIVAALELDDPAVVVGDVDREEIWLGVEPRRDDDDVAARALEVVRAAFDELEELDGEGASAVLVYAATRRRCEELGALFGEAGLEPVVYHGGLAARARQEVHRGFRDGSVRLVVATSAFGLGVDRPDVRLVLHTEPTDSLEEYWQEAGRAGRDGGAARALLLTRPDGYGLRRWFAASAGATVEDLRAVVRALGDGDVLRGRALAERSGLSPRRARRAVNALERVGAVTESRAGVRLLRTADPVGRAEQFVADLQGRRESAVELVRRYAETDDCRRRLVLELLGEEHPQPCGHCDNCDAGRSAPATDRPYRVGAAVEHPEFGHGQVVGYEEDRVTVLFEGGYRTLALELVQEERLLRPAQAGS